MTGPPTAGEGAGTLGIIVCMKVVLDPETPFSTFTVDSEQKRAAPPAGVPPVFSPFDENALEAALRIKDEHACAVTVLSVGRSVPRALLQKALAAGADQAIAVEDPSFEDLGPFDTSAVLAAAIRRIGSFDLVFTGRQAADWDAGLVWAGIAELLDLPCVTLGQKVEPQAGTIIVERCVSDGLEIVEAGLPALVTFGDEVGDLRTVSLADLMRAKRQEITRWPASEIDFREADSMELCDLRTPVLRTSDCWLVEGEDPREKGRNLARRLLADGIVDGTA